MPTAIFQFDPNLQSLLPAASRHRRVLVRWTGPQTAKHLIESMGIPHTEIHSVSSQDHDVGLGYLVGVGDVLVITGVNAEDPMEEPRFVVDGHLGRLAAGLRMLGMDCAYDNHPSDVELAAVASTQTRVLLTRDRRLLMRKAVIRGGLVRSQLPDVQLVETCRRYDLLRWSRPFTRCIRCNTLLLPTEKASILDRLPPLTRQYYEDFRICPNCSQPYWAGSHLTAMQDKIRRLAISLASPRTEAADTIGPSSSLQPRAD